MGPAEGDARMYVCGITPYDATHIGHANTYVAFDLLHRSWLDRGLSVNYVQNVTDIDDPLLERAAQTGVDWVEVAESQTQLFREDMAALNVLPPTSFVGAVESIPLIVELIEQLRETGAVYPVADAEHPDLYFAQASDPEFGSLSQLSPDDAVPDLRRARRRSGPGGQEGPAGLAGLAPAPGRASRPGTPAGRRPAGLAHRVHGDRPGPAGHQLRRAGRGQRPGLPAPRDVRLRARARPPASRSRRRTCTAGWSRWTGRRCRSPAATWSSSRPCGGAGVDPMAIRLALLSQHYRTDWDWTDGVLEAAVERLDLWREAVRLDAALNADQVLDQVRTALADDLDAPAALAAIDAWAGASVAVDSDDTDAPALVARLCDALLGVSL